MSHARAAIVTGGGGGIGEATARLLADRGFAVLIVDIDAEPRGAGGRDDLRRGRRGVLGWPAT